MLWFRKKYVLDGYRFTDKQAAHKYIAETLKFPDYYGNNLDALADCLSEMKKRTRITITNCDYIIDSLGNYGKSIIDIFQQQGNEFELEIIIKND